MRGRGRKKFSPKVKFFPLRLISLSHTVYTKFLPTAKFFKPPPQLSPHPPQGPPPSGGGELEGFAYKEPPTPQRVPLPEVTRNGPGQNSQSKHVLQM